MECQKVGVYRTAQVCLDGHMVTSSADLYPELQQDFCSKCGSRTTKQCLECHSNIRGYYDVEGIVSLGPDKPQAFCHACGKPYPWTTAKLEAARELADELDGLDDAEREKLKGTLDDLVRDTPRTELAATRFKRLMSKARGAAAPVLGGMVRDLATETAKKLLFGA